MKDQKSGQAIPPSSSALAREVWAPEASAQDIILFDSGAFAHTEVESGREVQDEGSGSEAVRDLVDLDVFRAAAPAWGDYRYKKMLALMKRMPRAVEERAQEISVAGNRQNLNLHCVYTAIKEWVDQQQGAPAVEKGTVDDDDDATMMEFESDKVQALGELTQAQKELHNQFPFMPRGKAAQEVREIAQSKVEAARQKFDEAEERLQKAKSERQAALMRRVADLLSDQEDGQKATALGLQWKQIGNSKPEIGKEIINGELAKVLQQKVDFDFEELMKYQVVDNFSCDSYIKVGDKYYRPTRRPVRSEEKDDVREWVFAVKKLNYKMSIGLVCTSEGLFHDWFHARHVNKAWFWQCCCPPACDAPDQTGSRRGSALADSSSHFQWHSEPRDRGGSMHSSTPTSKGFLANGDRIHAHTQERFEEGSHVVIKLNRDSGKVSFWLRDAAQNGAERMVGKMEGDDGVVGEVYPAVCLHVNGDCVEFDPVAQRTVTSHDGNKTSSAHGDSGSGQGTKNVKMQTAGDLTDVDEKARPYHYAHGSTVSQIERQLDEAEELLQPYQRWPGMTATGWIGKIGQLPEQGLAGPKKLLALTRAILDGNASSAVSQVKLVNLPADAQHQEIRGLFMDKLGFSPVSLSLKLDRDFLHPSDRVKLASSMRNENMTAFVTLTNKQQQAQALQLDKHVFRGRRLRASPVQRSDAKALQHEGEKLITLAHRMLSLEHDLRAYVTRLQRDAASSIDAVFVHLDKRDGSQAKAALERARESVTRLPGGKLLAVEQDHLEDEMQELQQQIDRQLRHKRDKAEDERSRLEREMKARLEKFWMSMAARGERKDTIAIELRAKRHELEVENQELIHQLERETSLKIDKLQQKLNASSSRDLEKRLQEAEDALHASYPWLNFYNVEDMLGRLDWLLDSAEHALRRIDRGVDDYVVAYECVTSARSLIAMPIGFDDRRRLGLDADKALNAVQLNSLQSHWHALLRAFPERGQLVRSYDFLVARLNTIERLLQSIMRPLRDRVFALMQRSSSHLTSRSGQQNVIEAARALREALQIQLRLPKELAPKDLAATVKQVDSQASLEIANAHAAFWLQAVQAHTALSKPLKDIYLSFDCGPSVDQLKNSKDHDGKQYPFGGQEGRLNRSEVYFQQQTDARGWAVFRRVKRALEDRGWTVHTSEDYPYETVYQEVECGRRGEKPLDLQRNGVMSRKAGIHGVGDYAESLGIRLQFSGDHTKNTTLEDSCLSCSNNQHGNELPVWLARACKERLTEMHEKARTEQRELDVDNRAQNTGEPSRLDGKVHVEASRFTVVSKPLYSSESNTTVIDIAVHPTQTKVDRCSVETLASTTYQACEQGTLRSLLGLPPDQDVKCHWPWPLPTRGTETADYDIKSAQKIQQSWAVLMLVTKRYMQSCQDPPYLPGRSVNTKAVSEMRNAVWFKGTGRIVTLLVDDAGDLGVPITWRGRMGDMLRDCASFGCSSHCDIDACMSKVDSHLNSTMAMSRQSASKTQPAQSITAVLGDLEPRSRNIEVPAHNGKPVAGGSLLTSAQELQSGFADALRSLPPHDAAGEALEQPPLGDSAKARHTRLNGPIGVPPATLSSALKMADSLPMPNTKKKAAESALRGNVHTRELTKHLHDLDQQLHTLVALGDDAEVLEYEGGQEDGREDDRGGAEDFLDDRVVNPEQEEADDAGEVENVGGIHEGGGEAEDTAAGEIEKADAEPPANEPEDPVSAAAVDGAAAAEEGTVDEDLGGA